MNSLSKGRMTDISVMRITATLTVIFLHTLSTLWINIGQFPMTGAQHLFTMAGSYSANWAVPLFFMITGALLLNPEKEITVSDCLKKYCRRILLALLIFGLPFSWLESIITNGGFSFSMFPQSLVNILTEESWGHLWYLYALLGIYLTLPIWKGYIKNSSRKTQRAVLIILLVISFIIPVFNGLFQIRIAFDLPMIAAPIFYLLAGRYFREEIPVWLRNKKRNAVFLALSFLAFLAVSIFADPVGFEYLGNYSPLIALITVLVFSLFSGIRVSEKADEKIWKIDRLCFGVYLIHPLFINFVYKFLGFTPLSFGNFYWLATVLFLIIFILCSFGASWVLQLIRPLKKYVL